MDLVSGVLRRSPAATVASLCLMTAMLYAPTIGYGFAYEDLNDPSAFFTPWQLGWTRGHPFRSLTRMTDTLCLWAGGTAPWPYHALGVLLHLVNGVLLAALAGPVAAAFVLWHPLSVETVTYVSARPDMLATTMVLLAMLAASRGWWPVALCAVGAAGLCKESAIVAWALVPLAAWWHEWPMPRGAVRVWLVAAAFGVGLAWSRVCLSCPATSTMGWPLTVSLAQSSEQIMAVTRYAAWTVVPVGLSVLHTWPSVPVATAGVIVAGWIALAYLWPRLRFALVWTAIALAPRLLVPFGDGLHDHHWSLPLVGIALAFKDRRC